MTTPFIQSQISGTKNDRMKWIEKATKHTKQNMLIKIKEVLKTRSGISEGVCVLFSIHQRRYYKKLLMSVICDET